ncbi:MAG TPA: histone deacetylase [Chloroflexota bacterium]|nr:histone deacetylase [Chloroflexota bacterium]
MSSHQTPNDPAPAGSLHVQKRIGLSYSPSFLEHDTGFRHPESIQRLQSIIGELETQALTDRLEIWEPAPANEETLSLVHSREHQRRVQDACAAGPANLDPDTTVSTGSWDAATRAAGGVVEAVERVIAGDLDRAFCLGRPPGHHALADRAMGFCLFNNVSVGARSAIYRGLAERVAIIDIDVHHGNGTQAIFYDDPNVLYCSTHQYPYYPGTGALDQTGGGSGHGATLNLPFPAGVGDDTYRYAMEQVMRPAIRRFEPEALLISLGFDAHWRDPLASIQLSLNGYAEMLAGLADIANSICQGRIVFVLEGGYDLEVLAKGSAMLVRMLLGDPVRDELGSAPTMHEHPIGKELVSAAARLHSLV